MSDFATKRRRKLLESLTVEAEFRRCQRDKEYAYSKYFYVPVATAEAGRDLFQMWDFQREIQEAYDTEDRVIALKTRQIGATTLAMLDSFHNGFFNTGRYELLVVSRSQEDARTNLSIMDHVYTFIPKWMKRRGPVRQDNTTERITFQHRDGSLFRAISIPGTATRGAGKTANRIVLDEFALMEQQSAVYRALEPATLAALSAPVRRGAVFVIISTPRGGRNVFAQQWKAAWHGELARWKALYYPVTCNKFLGPAGSAEAAFAADRMRAAGETVPLETLAKAESFWTAWRNLSQDPAYSAEPWKFYSEYARSWEEALRESGRARFPYLPESADCPPMPYAAYFKSSKGEVEIELADGQDDYDLAPWKMAYLPEEWPRDRQIVLAADTASGQLGDYSAAIVLATAAGPDGEDAAEILAAFWSNTITPVEFADELVRAGRYFKSAGRTAAIAVVERPPGGAGDGEVIARMRQMRYPGDCMFRYKAEDRVSARKSAVYGWPTDRSTKPEAIRALSRLLGARQDEQGEMRPHTLLFNLFPELRDELTTFVVLNNPGDKSYEKLGGDAGAHDDLVMAAAMGAAVLERVRKKGKARTENSSGGAVRPPDGPLVLWDPRKLLQQEKQKADEKREQEAEEWNRRSREQESIKRLNQLARRK